MSHFIIIERLIGMDVLADLKFYGVLCGFIVFFVAIVGFIIYGNARRRRRDRQFGQDVVAHGWQYQTYKYYHKNNHRLSGVTSGGLSWELDIAETRPNNEFDRRHMLWKTPDIRLEGAAVLVGPWATGQRVPTGPTGKLTQVMMRPFIHYTTPGITIDQVKFLQTIQPVELGDGAFRQKYLVYTTDPYQAGKVVENGLDRVLMEYIAQMQKGRRPPAVVIWPWGMHVKFDHVDYDFARLERIVAFGEALANTQRTPGW